MKKIYFLDFENLLDGWISLSILGNTLVTTPVMDVNVRDSRTFKKFQIVSLVENF